MAEFEGKIALVTGASSGIGRATVRLLAKGGARVIGFDLNPAELPELAGFHRVDVTRAVERDAAMAEVRERWGRIDILINCAGGGGMGTAETVPVDEWHRVIDLNLGSTIGMCQAVLPGMRQRRSGAIVNIGSTFGLMARNEAAPYSVAKAAVIQFTRCMAIDLQDSGVRVNCVCPGLIKTGMTSYLMSDEMREPHRRNVEAHALRRHGEPEEVAAAIAFLVSDRASFVTGAAMPVDGGYTSGKWV